MTLEMASKRQEEVHQSALQDQLAAARETSSASDARLKEVQQQLQTKDHEVALLEKEADKVQICSLLSP